MSISFFFFFSGTSSVAVAWNGTFDDLIDNIIAKTLEKHTPMDSPGLAPYLDFFAAGLIMLLAGNICDFYVKVKDIRCRIFHKLKF